MLPLIRSCLKLAPTAALLAIALAAPAYGCPNCRAANGGQELDAWFWSIVIMAFAPFVVGGTFLGFIVRSCRKAKREETAGGAVVDGR